MTSDEAVSLPCPWSPPHSVTFAECLMTDAVRGGGTPAGTYLLVGMTRHLLFHSIGKDHSHVSFQTGPEERSEPPCLERAHRFKEHLTVSHTTPSLQPLDRGKCFPHSTKASAPEDSGNFFLPPFCPHSLPSFISFLPEFSDHSLGPEAA
jgi:hypothetical protein